jgi:hypothetical protein
LNLTAGKQLFITGTLQSRSQPYRPQQPGGILIRLYDVSKNQVAVNYETLIYTALQSGSYYCEISSSGLGDFWNKYRLSVHQYDPFTLISPNGGENFEAGQKVTVRYKGNSLGRGVSFSYSIDNRKTWIDSTSTFLGYDSTTWIVPALKKQNSQVEMKIEVQGMADKLFDISDNTFTIQAVPNDQYEPNNSMASAYSVSIGDSVVTNASTCRYLDSVMLYDYDYEYYKVYLKAGSLLRIPIWNTDSERSWDEPEYDVFDSSGLMEPLPNNGPVQIKNYIIENSGVYFIEVYAKHAGIGDLVKYGMSIKPVTILASSNSILDTNAMTQTLAYSDYAYKSRVTFDKTSLTIDFLVRNKIPSIISKMELNPEDFDSLPGEIVKVKAFAIYPYSSPWGLLGMTVSVPYNPSVLNGFSAKNIAVAHQDL